MNPKQNSSHILLIAAVAMLVAASTALGIFGVRYARARTNYSDLKLQETTLAHLDAGDFRLPLSGMSMEVQPLDTVSFPRFHPDDFERALTAGTTSPLVLETAERQTMPAYARVDATPGRMVYGVLSKDPDDRDFIRSANLPYASGIVFVQCTAIEPDSSGSYAYRAVFSVDRENSRPTLHPDIQGLKTLTVLSSLYLPDGTIPFSPQKTYVLYFNNLFFPDWPNADSAQVDLDRMLHEFEDPNHSFYESLGAADLYTEYVEPNLAFTFASFEVLNQDDRQTTGQYQDARYIVQPAALPYLPFREIDNGAGENAFADSAFLSNWQTELLNRLSSAEVLATPNAELLYPFYNKTAYISQGRFFVPDDYSGTEPVCLISRDYAELNRLQPGDRIWLTFYNNGYAVLPQGNRDIFVPNPYDYAEFDMNYGIVYTIAGIYHTINNPLDYYAFTPNTIIVPQRHFIWTAPDSTDWYQPLSYSEAEYSYQLYANDMAERPKTTAILLKSADVSCFETEMAAQGLGTMFRYAPYRSGNTAAAAESALLSARAALIWIAGLWILLLAVLTLFFVRRRSVRFRGKQ